ncbi:MAG: DUF4349 domain-containing protein [Anaerolineales bacterium]|nr:DUF4349 domain-containing protein [Anaerolineales bacterium]
MKKILPFSFIVIAALILAACGSSARYSEEAPLPAFGGGSAPAAAPEMYDAMPAPTAGIADSYEASGSGNGVQAAAVERIVIQNADVAIVVSDVEARMREIEIMAQQLGGFVVSSNLYQSYTNNYVEVPEAQVVIRVPAESLEDALKKIKTDVVEVRTETRSGQDVTAEYVDLKSRLVNLEAAEKQLSEIMETATETEDVVNVFNQLVYYREQIEIVKGQMKYYEEAAALSAITITIIAEEKDQPIEIGGWEPQGVAKDAVQDLIYFYQDFVNFVIRFVIYTLPVWITVGIPLYLIFIGARFLFRKLRGNKKKVVDAKVEEDVKK